MIQQLFSIRDKKVGVYYPPQPYANPAHAMRGHTDLFSNPQSQFNKYASDFDVYHIADFDDQSGCIECCAPEFLVNGADLVAEINRNLNIKGA